MVGISASGAKVSSLVVDADLEMGAHAITLGAGVLVDGVDVSAITTAKMNAGDHVGSGVANRVVAHGLGVVPRLVVVTNNTESRVYVILGSDPTKVYCITAGTKQTVTQMTATNFYTHVTGGSDENTDLIKWTAYG